ncbi:MAG: hypothetical protein DHS20C17_17720 [Cyclobacteriaceae bacterium]|nr:MAG: hypothetical protein DHS20C17_17720 [Cyclobacteriaceae bacterium]
MNGFNMNTTGFLLALQRGKNKNISSNDRKKNAFLAAMLPQDNFSGIITPIALVDKEAAKKERDEAVSQRNVLAVSLNKANEYVIELMEAAADDDSKAEIVAGYIKKVYPQIELPKVAGLPVFKLINNADIKEAVVEKLF